MLLFVNMIMMGCYGSSSADRKESQMISPPTVKITENKQDEKNISEVIVVFKKGITLEEAKKVIASYGMQILKVYKKISDSTGTVMLHISSTLPIEKTLQQLCTDNRILSVSPNYQRGLK